MIVLDALGAGLRDHALRDEAGNRRARRDRCVGRRARDDEDQRRDLRGRGDRHRVGDRQLAVAEGASHRGGCRRRGAAVLHHDAEAVPGGHDHPRGHRERRAHRDVRLVVRRHDRISPRALYVIAAGAAVTIVVSSLWPLATGTSTGALFHGVVIQPLGQADNLQRQHGVRFEPITFLLAVLTVYAVLARRYGVNLTGRARTWQLDAAFGLTGFFGFGLVIYGGFGEWIPIIVMLPALALLSDASPRSSLAIRLLVPLAILQFLHAYPVAGSQIAWVTRVRVRARAIVIAAAADRLPGWREVGPAVRSVDRGVLAVLTVVARRVPSPRAVAQLRRPGPAQAPGDAVGPRHDEPVRHLHHLVKNVQRHCDTFYSAPGIDSLYLYTRLPNPTGLLADGPGRAQRQGTA